MAMIALTEPRRVLLTLATLACTLPARAATSPQAAVEADAHKRGLQVIKVVAGQDVDGDGRPDAVAALKNDSEEVVLGAWKLDGNRATLLGLTPSTSAHEVLDLQARNVCADGAAELVAVLREIAPDETRRGLRIYRWNKQLTEVLNLGFQENQEEEDGVISYGDAEQGFKVVDLDGDGQQEVIIRREPKRIKVPGGGEKPLTLLVGVRESIFVWSPKDQRYQEKQDRQVNFIPALHVRRVSASSQKLPAKLRQAEQDRTLEQSLDMAFSDDEADAPLRSDAPVVANPAPRAYWGADNNLDTAWVENDRGSGAGQWLEVHLRGGEHDLKMVRVVPVCADSAAHARGSNVVQVFSLVTGGGDRLTVDVSEKEPSDSGVAAVLHVPSPDRKYAPQLLVFLKPGLKSSSVKLVLDRVKKKSRTNDACISELSVH